MKLKYFALLVTLLFINSISLAAENSIYKNEKVIDGTVATYEISNNSFTDQINYTKAIKINSEMVIIYSNQGMLDRAKTKLIKAQSLSIEHNIDLAIVDYATGYYYQAIGANSIAEEHYKKAVKNHHNNYQAMNFYGQFLCIVKKNFTEAQLLFDKSLFISTNDNMAQTLYMYSECLYKDGKKNDAIAMMIKSTKFGSDYMIAKLRLGEIYFEIKNYKQSYKIIYSMSNNEVFLNNKRVLDLRLKLAKVMDDKNEAAMVQLILSSNDYNEDDSVDDFYLSEAMNDN